MSPEHVGWIQSVQRIPIQDVCRILARALCLPVDEVVRAAGHWPSEALIEFDAGELGLILFYRATWPDLRRVAVATLRAAYKYPPDYSR